VDTRELSCIVCKHEWETTNQVDPYRCANPKCRSKRWKDGHDKRDDLSPIVVHVDGEQRGQFECAAKRDGKKVGEWLRDLGVVAIAPPAIERSLERYESLRQAANNPPIQAPVVVESLIAKVAQVERPSGRGWEDPGSSPGAAPPSPLPGSAAGFGKDAMAFLAERGIKVGVKVAEVVDVGDAPAEDVKTRPWLPELKKLMAKGEFEDVTEDFNALYGRQFRPPKGWGMWDLARRAQWLDANAPLEAVAPRNQTVILRAPEGEDTPF
jgi:hypothetical protein